MRENAAQKQFLLAETFNEAAESPVKRQRFPESSFSKIILKCDVLSGKTRKKRYIIPRIYGRFLEMDWRET